MKPQPSSDHALRANGHAPHVVLRSKATYLREQDDLARLQQEAGTTDQETNVLREETRQVEAALTTIEQELEDAARRLADLNAERERLNRQHRDASNRRTQLIDATEKLAAEAEERWARVADKEEMLRLLVQPEHATTPIGDQVQRMTGPQRIPAQDVQVADAGPGDTQVSAAVRERGR